MVLMIFIFGLGLRSPNRGCGYQLLVSCIYVSPSGSKILGVRVLMWSIDSSGKWTTVLKDSQRLEKVESCG